MHSTVFARQTPAAAKNIIKQIYYGAIASLSIYCEDKVRLITGIVYFKHTLKDTLACIW